ncbi:uncharacterized protein LOC143666273 isoform X4 [Tamandua tetradactyla]|uniref:uncharacterized protein LOC143666273 isoform X4 n=1 Tax=Tamandua tetradactyla TaxID=48850 RepID=UPI004053E7E3
MLLESLDFPGGSQGELGFLREIFRIENCCQKKRVALTNLRTQGNLQRNFSAGVTSLHSNMSTNCLGVRNCTELEANKYERSKRREGKKKEDSHKVIQKDDLFNSEKI